MPAIYIQRPIIFITLLYLRFELVWWYSDPLKSAVLWYPSCCGILRLDLVGKQTSTHVLQCNGSICFTFSWPCLAKYAGLAES